MKHIVPDLFPVVEDVTWPDLAMPWQVLKVTQMGMSLQERQYPVSDPFAGWRWAGQMLIHPVNYVRSNRINGKSLYEHLLINPVDIKWSQTIMIASLEALQTSVTAVGPKKTDRPSGEIFNVPNDWLISSSSSLEVEEDKSPLRVFSRLRTSFFWRYGMGCSDCEDNCNGGGLSISREARQDSSWRTRAWRWWICSATWRGTCEECLRVWAFVGGSSNGSLQLTWRVVVFRVLPTDISGLIPFSTTIENKGRMPNKKEHTSQELQGQTRLHLSFSPSL